MQEPGFQGRIAPLEPMQEFEAPNANNPANAPSDVPRAARAQGYEVPDVNGPARANAGGFEVSDVNAKFNPAPMPRQSGASPALAIDWDAAS